MFVKFRQRKNYRDGEIINKKIESETECPARIEHSSKTFLSLKFDL